MKPYPVKFFLIAFVVFFTTIFSYGQQGSLKTGDSIQITQLKDIILSLPKSFKNFSIGSGAGDQISISNDGKKNEISYRQEDPAYAGKFSRLKDFAENNGYDMKMIDGSDPKTAPAGQRVQLPTITIKEKDREAAYELVKAIMLSVFKNAKNIYYGVVMPEGN